MLSRYGALLATLALVVSLAGLVIYIAVVLIPVGFFSEPIGENILLPVITLLAGGPIFIVLAVTQWSAAPSSSLPLAVLYLAGFILALLLVRTLDRSLRRWGVFSFLVPFVPPLVLGILGWLKQPVYAKPAPRGSPVSPPASKATQPTVVQPLPHPAPSLSQPPPASSSPPRTGATPAQQTGNMAAVLDWCRRHGDWPISVDVITQWPGGKDMNVHRAQGKIRNIEQHPTQPGIYRIEFDSKLQGPEYEYDFVLLGHEVSGVSEAGSQLVIQKGPNQRIELTAQQPETVPEAPPAAPAPAAPPAPRSEPLRCSVCGRSSEEVMAAFQRQRPEVLILDTTWIGVCPDCGQAFCVFDAPRVRDSWGDKVPACPIHGKPLVP